MTGRRLIAPCAGLVGLAIVVACGTGASSPDSCRAIEEARCRRAPGCNLPLEPPYSTSGTDVDACIRFYDAACLHGLDVGNPGQTAVNQCVSAINTGTCAVVATPQSDVACLWLVPQVSTTPDATTDVLTEASIDAGEDGDGE